MIHRGVATFINRSCGEAPSFQLHHPMFGTVHKTLRIGANLVESCQQVSFSLWFCASAHFKIPLSNACLVPDFTIDNPSAQFDALHLPTNNESDQSTSSDVRWLAWHALFSQNGGGKTNCVLDRRKNTLALHELAQRWCPRAQCKSVRQLQGSKLHTEVPTFTRGRDFEPKGCLTLLHEPEGTKLG